MRLTSKRVETLRKIVVEELQKELFDSKPFHSSFKFKTGKRTIWTSFEDPMGNQIDVYFTKEESLPETFFLDFSVNNQEAPKPEDLPEYKLTDFTSLVATVALAVEQFLQETKPRGVVIQGLDSLHKPFGQKDRIYGYFISQLTDTKGYGVNREKDSITLIKRKNVK